MLYAYKCCHWSTSHSRGVFGARAGEQAQEAGSQGFEACGPQEEGKASQDHREDREGYCCDKRGCLPDRYIQEAGHQPEPDRSDEVCGRPRLS